ncbi:MAG: M23 family metallopeptidase [Rikenellaceae bacterium]
MSEKIKTGKLYKYLAVSVIFILSLSAVAGQDKDLSAVSMATDNFRLPLDLTVSLSGSYGELRATHFHAGLDFRIGGVVGARVYAVSDGFISRISISPTGYGNSLYIQHPNGTTSLYGHLLDFAPKIASWIELKQYETETFVINIFPDSTLFHVKRGDFIGRAGNSGSSGGPHLHFEIRDTKTQIPLDPVKEGEYKITDNIVPQILRVNFYSIKNSKSLPERILVKSYTVPATTVTVVSDTFYVAVEAIDRMNNTGSRLAVAKYNYYLDKEKIFSFSPVAIPFDKGRYINAMVEYSEKQQYGRSMVKSWVEPGNALINNIKAKDDGLFILNDDKEHTVMVEAVDYKGNRATRSFKVKRGTIPAAPEQDSATKIRGKIMPWFIPNTFELGNMKLTLPPGSLYSSILFTADSSVYNGTTLWRLHNENTPVQIFAKLSIKSYIPLALRDKAIIVVLDEKGRYNSLGGEWKGDYLEASIGSFGRFLVTVDTIAPRIFPSFKEGENISLRKTLKFTIDDDLSGIASYKVYIDGKWILANFDAKTRSLVVGLDPLRVIKEKTHTLEIIVSDNRGNINNVKTSFIW